MSQEVKVLTTKAGWPNSDSEEPRATPEGCPHVCCDAFVSVRL